MSEADIEAEIVEHCECRGCLCLKLAINGIRGFPDRTILTPCGQTAFIEIKRPGGKLSHHQKKWLMQLRELGFVANKVESVDQVRELLYDLCGK